MKKNWLWLAAALALLPVCGSFLSGQDKPPNAHPRNILIFVFDGLRAGSVNAEDSPTMFWIRTHGVSFPNSHSLFPTFTTANASAIATGHYLGDTGDYSNQIYIGHPVFFDGTSAALREPTRLTSKIIPCWATWTSNSAETI